MHLNRWASWVIGVAWRVSLATAICLTYFHIITIRIDSWPLPRQTLFALVYLDTPVGLVKWLLPCSWRPGMSLVLRGDSTYCVPAPFAVERARYLAVGIPVWTAVLYGITKLGKTPR